MTARALPPSSLSPRDFVSVHAGIYEHSKWVAEAIAAEGISAADDDPDALSKRMARVVDAAGQERQLELLRLHPELVGRLRIGEALTESSRKEQAGAQLDQCSPEEFARFQALNLLYRERFGFPFIIAVTGLARADILAAFEARVANSYVEEFRTALEQVHRIALIRLNALARERTQSA